MFQFFNDGRGAALATVLFIAVLPVMYLNLRNFRRQQGDVMTAPAAADRTGLEGARVRFWRPPFLQSLPLRALGPRHLPPVDAADGSACSSPPSGTRC